jgi:probable rRNA maturation factor
LITIYRRDFNLLIIHKKKLRNKIEKVFEILQLSNQELSIVFESKNRMRFLKREYLGIDKTTDVLSFESRETNPESGNTFLGDILISPGKAKQQAKEKHTSIDLEILTLCIHGILHLLGYDHASKSEAQILFSLQDKILGEIYEK